jgi:hypothetical protein
MKPEVLGKDAWPVAIAPLTKMSVAHRDCVLCANRNLTKAVKMGERVYEKAREDHVSFLRIIKQGAAALTGACREKAKAEADLKKSQAAAAAAPDRSILKLEKAHTNKKIRELTKSQEKDEKTIQKLETKVEELKMELKKVKSTTDLTAIVPFMSTARRVLNSLLSIFRKNFLSTLCSSAMRKRLGCPP